MRLVPELLVACASVAAAAGCLSENTAISNEAELITNVTLTFTPASGGAAVTAVANDPDGEGGGPPDVDPVRLQASETYALTVQFRNTLEDPPEEITEEVRDEAEDHQVFFTGTAVAGPASDQPGAALTHAYADLDASGLPVGLASSITTSTGTGTLIVTLRHLPPLDETPTKTAGLAAEVSAGGFGAIPGATDAQVTFLVTVP
jgi:hypothetical protein